MKLRRGAASLCCVALFGCGARQLSSQDLNSLHDSEAIDLEIYDAAGVSTEIGALAHAAFCSDDAVLRRNDAGASRINGPIQCTRPARK